MKKVAIMTWCYDNGPVNYGQILQCYALQRTCENLGLETVVIKYRRLRDDEDINSVPAMGKTREKYEYAFRDRYVERQNKKDVMKFLDFIDEEIHLTPQCYSEDDLKAVTEDADCLVLGSDQLWNPIWFDPLTLLSFADGKKKISYATGGVSGLNDFNKPIIRQIAEGISDFSTISVRERKSAEILLGFTDRKISVTLDPTLLLRGKDWETLCVDMDIQEGSYGLCFCLGEIQPHKHLLKLLAERYEVKRIIYVQKEWSNHGFNEESLFCAVNDVGPCEFLSFVKKATFVATDSFHGFCFSLLFERDVFLFERAYVSDDIASGSRIYNLQEITGCGDRWLRYKQDLVHMGEIEYAVVRSRMEECRSSSLEFLKRSIG